MKKSLIWCRFNSSDKVFFHYIRQDFLDILYTFNTYCLTGRNKRERSNIDYSVYWRLVWYWSPYSKSFLSGYIFESCNLWNRMPLTGPQIRVEFYCGHSLVLRYYFFTRYYRHLQPFSISKFFIFQRLYCFYIRIRTFNEYISMYL